MAEIKGFCGLRYAPQAGDLATLVCPPYDIVQPDQRAALVAGSPYNAIQLELPVGEQPYQQAAALLKDWCSQGILATDDTPGMYIYEEEFIAHGKPYKIKGLTVRVRLEEFEKKVVLPHEWTLDKPKDDRLRLMNATSCDFSSVYSMYHDKTGKIFPQVERLSEREPDQIFTTKEDGIVHRLWLIYDPKEQAVLTEAFEDEQLYIADGHHRYATMLNYRDQLRREGVITDAEHPANFGLMTLMNLTNPGLVVFPTHRLVRGLDSFDLAELLKRSEKHFKVEETTPKQLEQQLVAQGAQGKKAFGVYSGGQAYLLHFVDSSIMKELLPDSSEAYRQLDVAILHTLVLEALLGIDKENLANQKNLVYLRDGADAITMVDGGEGNVAFLINATGVEEIAAVADADEKMPQKSTYFYPKLITGHLFYQVNQEI